METMMTTTLCYQHCKCRVLFLVFAVAFVLLVSPANAVSRNETDRMVLLEFKSKIRDSFGAMNSWNDSNHFCDWFGVICGKLHQQRVTELNLNSMQLGGSISPHIGNLSFLRVIDLSNNTLKGQIPSELGHLRRLKALYLGGNSLSGEIPSDLFVTLPNLQVLHVATNQLTGSIPASLSNASNLERLHLESNLLTGKVPCLGKLKALKQFSVSNNSLGTRGPNDLDFLCSLTNATELRKLDISFNELGGPLPECIGNLSSKLHGLWLNNNYISGNIPAGIANLISLTDFYANTNKLSGKVPSLQKLNALNKLIISHNSLGTRGPSDLNFLCSLTDITNLQAVDIASNDFGGSLPECICNLTSKLTVIWLRYNHISGTIPSCTTPSVVSYLSLSNNNISGTIPQSLCNATKLDVLDLHDNHLEGTIPDCLISSSQTLSVLNLRGNNLSGSIPNTFGKSCRLDSLDLSGNFLQGQIPRSLANCNKLKYFNLGHNQLNDTFPCELRTLSQLQVLILRSNRFRGEVVCPGKEPSWPLLQILDLASNNFSGQITVQFIAKWRLMISGTKEVQNTPYLLGYYSKVLGSVTAFEDSVTLTFKNNNFLLQRVPKIFTSIDLSDNAFHGEIPTELGNLNALIVLNLSQNSFTGNIPSSFGNLSQLESLDVSRNALHGNIPQELAKLNFLEYLNVSFNNLVGLIPTSTQLQSFDASSYKGNPGLHGPPLTGVHVNVPESGSSAYGDGSQWSSKSRSETREWMLQGAQVGFPIGLIIFVGPLLYIRRWRHWYFGHLGRLLRKIMGIEEQSRTRRSRRRR